MSKEEQFISFLEERIATARSIRSNAAYTLVLDRFMKLFLPKGIEKESSTEREKY